MAGGEGLRLEPELCWMLLDPWRTEVPLLGSCLPRPLSLRWEREWSGGGAGSSMEGSLLGTPWPVSRAGPHVFIQMLANICPPSLHPEVSGACCGVGDISMSKHQWGSPRGAQNSAGKTDVATMKSGL